MRAVEAQALSALARQLTPQADERGSRVRGKSCRRACCCWPSWPWWPPPAGSADAARPPRPPRAARGAARRHRRSRVRRRLPADGARRRGPDRQRQSPTRPTRRPPGQAGHLGRQPDRRDALPPRRRPQARLHATAPTTAPAPSRSRCTAPACSPRPRDSVVVHALRRGGKGAWITVYTNPGHAFAVIAGLRLDTSAAGDPPAARARAGARTCAPRAATGPATRSGSRGAAPGGTGRRPMPLAGQVGVKGPLAGQVGEADLIALTSPPHSSLRIPVPPAQRVRDAEIRDDASAGGHAGRLAA